jgi:hypothetical protein
MVDKLIMNPETYKQHFADKKGNWDKAPEIHAEECRKACDRDYIGRAMKLEDEVSEKLDTMEESYNKYRGMDKKAAPELKASEHDLLDKEIEKLKDDKKKTLHEVKFTIDDSYYKNLRPLGETREAVNPTHEYSFQDAFRWLLKGKTIKFVNDRRRFKIVEGEIIELLEFQGFSSKCMLHDRFYVEEKE